MIQSLNAMAKIAGLIVLVVTGTLMASQALIGPSSPTAEATNLNELKKLLASDAQPDDEFGYSVAVSGDTAVVGAHREDALATNAGAAYVFQRAEGGTENWGEVKKLTASDAEADDRFGWSVAVSGDTIVVGAYREDTAASFAGAVYVFQRDEGGTNNWGEVKKLTASDAQAGDRFGWSVAISGDTAVIGAQHEDTWGSFAGAAYLLARDQGGTNNWGEVKKLTASDAQAGDEFGYSVAASANIALIGSRGEDSAAGDAGAAYIYRRDEGGVDNWGEMKKLVASDAQISDEFGWSAAVSGATAVIGAYQEDAGGTDAGAAYVFQRNQGGADNWGEVIKLTAADAHAFDRFGYSVAISGDTTVVGARWKDSAGINSGAAYLFRRNEGGPGNWGEVTKLIASDADGGDKAGMSVGISNDTALVGAFWEDSAGTNAGAAYIFDLLQPKPTPTPTSTPCPGGKVPANGGCGTPTPTLTPTVTSTPTITPTPGPPMPDLIPTSMSITLETGGDCDFTPKLGVRVNFSNAGTADAGPFTVSVNGAQQNVGAGLMQGESGTLWFNGYIAGKNTLLVDSSSQIVESNELNNELSQTPAIPTPPATCTPIPTKLPDPGDTDSDGCSDQDENGPDETVGGRRDFKNPNDFYDVETISGPGQDGVVDLLFDILSVINHYSPAGDPPYDAHYDRGPSAGPNAWNMTAPDGVIDLLNDILGVIQQFDHTCT